MKAQQNVPLQSPIQAPLAALEDDAYLRPYMAQIEGWKQAVEAKQNELCGSGTLCDFALGHLYFGLHRLQNGAWIVREWAPNATEIYLYGDATNWQLHEDYRFERMDQNWQGNWQLELRAEQLQHGQYFALWVRWGEGGQGRRLPSYTRRAVQDAQSKIFSAQVWEEPYEFRHPKPQNLPQSFGPQSRPQPAPNYEPQNSFCPLIYEAHIGMAQEHEQIGSYARFTKHVLPYIANLGYNTVQLMGILEHPYYGSFGYHVSNLFAVSSRFGTPKEFKELVDEAHRLGLRVIIDLVHSHHVRNEEEGLANFAGERSQYFYPGERGEHRQWDSYVYDYGKNQVLHYLLSNLQFWLCEYNLDGFRFDGVTSMLYEHRGAGVAFDGYDAYFAGAVDPNALVYLALANRLVHELQALSIAEDVSGFPGLASRELLGFDYRLAMGVTDYWFKLLDIPDENWNMFALWHELSQGRQDERTISYVESHDQALVGGKSFIFTMIDSDMYWHMDEQHRTIRVDRGLALHKMARLLTLAAGRHGYLNFMGNEFGHPEWIDFPREGNNWSYHHSRRLWSLAFRDDLLFEGLRRFEEDMQALFAEAAALHHSIDWLHLYDEDKIICFRRAGLWLVFNFHPTRAVSDYRIPVCSMSGAEYRIALDSDAERYKGFAQLDPNQHYFAQRAEGHSYIQVYLPPRLAIVLERAC